MASIDTIDEETAISFISSKGYTCVKLDEHTKKNTDAKMFGLNFNEISHSMHVFLIVLFVFCAYRTKHLRMLLAQVKNAEKIKNKKRN